MELYLVLLSMLPLVSHSLSLIPKVHSKMGITDELLSWQPPAEMRKLYPYEISGLDREGSPICTVRMGRWDVRSTMMKGDAHIKNFERYTEQMWLRFHNSPEDFGANGTTDYILIADMGDFSVIQLTHIPTMMEILALTRQFVEVDHLGTNGKQGLIVNANYVFEMLYDSLRPVLGNLANLIEVYGTSSEKWKPKLLKLAARDQLPEWAGGYKNHKPLLYIG